MADYDLIVVGAGPAGTSAAAIAARAGLNVLLVASRRHPYLHIGESFLPGIIPILDEMGALEDVESAGFTRKTGATHWNWGKTAEWDLWFAGTDEYDHAWLAERARFDEILLDAAVRAGVRVQQESLVSDLVWRGDRLLGIDYKVEGRTDIVCARAPFTVDASGQSALVGRKLGLRKLIPGLKHHATWAHYEGAGRLPHPRRDQALLVADERHWFWYFPLSETLTSVGIVFEEDDTDTTDDLRAQSFDDALAGNDSIAELLGSGARRTTRVVSQRDWSYEMTRVAGPGWLLAGDASGFIDPVLSTGVFLAMHGGAHAAHTVARVLQNGKAEEQGISEYQSASRDLFDDIVRTVRFFYRRNLKKEDYFWQSKELLDDIAPGLKPQKAFLVLTSGLIKNLALDERRTVVLSERKGKIEGKNFPGVETHDPETLGFVCLHIVLDTNDAPADLYFLIEPAEPADPTLFRTQRYHLNCLAPRFANDPISHPECEPHLRQLARTIDGLDNVEGESLAAFWRRTRHQIVAAVRAWPDVFDLVRVFGE